MGHYDPKRNGREPPWSTWVSHNRSRLPKIAFAYAEGDDRSKWKLPHHWIDGQGTLYVHKGGVRAAIRMVGHTDISEAAKERARVHLIRHRNAFERRDDVKDEQVKQVLDMLADEEEALALDVIREVIEGLQGDLSEAVDENKSLELDLEGVEDKLQEALSLAESRRQELITETTRVKTFGQEKDDLQNSLTAAEEQLAAGRVKLIDGILGKMEVCGDSQEKRDRMKESLVRMDLPELDGAFADVMERWREKFVVKAVGDPGDVPVTSFLDGLPVVSLG